MATLAELLELPAGRCRAHQPRARKLARVSGRCRSPTMSLTSNMPRSPSACPSFPEFRRRAASPAYYPAGAAVGQLVGYVGTANAKEYEAENKNPLLLVPGVKIGKEGLEKTLEPTLRAASPAGSASKSPPRGKLIRELEPKPDRSGSTVQLTIDAGPPGICRPPAGRGIGQLHDHRLRDRRYFVPRLDAGLRPQQLLRRDRPDRMVGAVEGRAQASGQQER